jgi:hypothetical protein
VFNFLDEELDFFPFELVLDLAVDVVLGFGAAGFGALVLVKGFACAWRPTEINNAQITLNRNFIGYLFINLIKIKQGRNV